MDLFLQETKNKLNNLSSCEKIHVVIGNEACDLDSTVSALVYAYFLNETKPSTENVFIPVLDIPRKQFRLRTEVTYFLHRLGIDETHLTFQDDIDPHDLHSQGKLSLTLVDHNLLLQKQADLDSCVVEVIDHRSNQRGDGDGNCPVTIEMVGSCATLITEKIVNTDASVLTEEVSTLLIGTILLDTVNFDPAVGKTTSKDIAMVEQLTEQFPSLDKNELYESLQSAKCDLSGLDPDEILLKDLKCLSNDVIKLGFSSITLHLEKFLQNDNVIEDFKSFCASHDIDILVIMAISIDEGTTTRQLAIYAHRHDNIKNDIIFKLECSIAPDLDLSPMVTSFEEITAYYQGNITASRKKVLPIFTEFLENMNTDTVREKDTVPSSSDLMDLDSDTLSAKSSGLSELTSEPSTTANTPSSPQKNVDLLGLDPFAPAPSTQPNDNANNNADQDPFGVLDTQLPPEILSPTGASDDSGFDPLVDVSPMSRTPDLISVSASSNVDNTFSTGQATWQQPDLFGVDDLPLKSQPEVDLFDPLGLGEVTSSGAQNIQAGTQDESNLIEVETQQKSLPVPIPSKFETGNETTQSPLIPLTPQNSYGSLSDAELSEIGDTKQRSVDLSNPDIAYAVHERLREVEEDENFHNFYSDVDNGSSDKVDGDNNEGLVFTAKEESTSDITHNEVANMMASDMTAEISTENHAITDRSEDSGRTAVDPLSDGQTKDENLNPTETIRNSGHNVIAEAISEDMAESRKEIVFPKKDVTKYEYNTVAKEIAQDMTTETEKISFANKNLTEFEHNVIADEIALDMAKSGEEIIFVKKDLTNFENNVIAEEFANSMATRGDAVTFAKKDLTEYRQNVIAHEIAELMAENRQGITFAKKDLTEYRHNAIAHEIAEHMVENRQGITFAKKDPTEYRHNTIAHEIAEHMVENRQGITFAKKDLTEYRHNAIAHEIAEHMLENRQGITFAKRDMTDLENNVIATEISENMAKEENFNESDRGEIESKSVTDISELQKIEFANKGSAFTDEQLKQNEVAKMIANDLYKDSMGQDYEINKVSSVSENEEVDKFSKRFDQDLQNEIDFEFTVTEPAIIRDNNVAEMIADDMDIDDHKRTTNFPEKAIDLTSAKYNVVADAIAKDMRNGEYCDFRFSKRDLQLPSDNVVARMFTEDMMNDADVDKELSMINQDLTYIEPSVRSTNIAAYMLAYTSIDETEGTIKGEGNTTPGDGDTVENGDHNSPNNDTPDDSTHPGVSESASNIMSEPFVPIDQPATSDPVTIADIEEHQEGLMTNRRVSSPSGDSESQTSGDEASTTSGSFSCSEIPSPVHHAITSIAEIEEPVSETEEDVVTVEVVPEKPTSNGVIESDIMEEERVVIGQEDNSDKTRATEVKAPEIESIPNDKATTPDLDKDEYPARTVNDLDAAQKEAVARYMEKYIDEEEEGDLMSSMRIAENVAKASPRKKSVPQRSIDAEDRMAGVNLKEEWQDDDDIMKHHADIGEDWLNDVIEIDITDPVPPRDDALTRPTSLDLGAKPKTRKKVSPPAELKITDNDDDRGSTPSDSFDLSRIDDLQTPDMRTPSLRDDSSILMTSGEMEWEDDTPLSKTTSSEKIPEYTAAEETKDNRHWRVVEIGGKNYNLDMKVIHPYKKVLSHGGYYGDGLNAIIVFAACYLPEKTRKDYNYVMDNLFLYVISTLDLLVAQDYMIIYFHGGCTKHQAPNLGWLKRCYKMIDRRLRKNLKALLLTHPNLWLKTVVRFSKPFISSKFSRKLRFVTSLEDLKQLTPLEYVYIPEQVKLFDDKKRKKKN